MNKDIALKMAIDAMEDMANGYDYILDVHGKIYGVGFDRVQEKAPKAIQACKEALEQPAQEPDGWYMIPREEDTEGYFTVTKPTRQQKISHEPMALYYHPYH